ncbi:MAG TPA: DUF2442 domain-containing protein [Gemmatimonadaceae bacterium]|nr:DUF2442 domain-containing protein [Gemmatimonadaceae bacterium]
MLDVVEVRHLHDYVLWLRFDDGTQGEVDLRAELWGEMFEALLDLNMFRRAAVNPDTGTIEWPNGADLAPEYLFERVKAAPA